MNAAFRRCWFGNLTRTFSNFALGILFALSLGAWRAPAAGMSLSSRTFQNGQVCAACVYFEFYASTGGSAPASRCKLIAGPINPAGWCEVWQAKG